MSLYLFSKQGDNNTPAEKEYTYYSLAHKTYYKLISLIDADADVTTQ